MPDTQVATIIHVFESQSTPGLFALTPDESGAVLPTDGSGWNATGAVETLAQITRLAPAALLRRLHSEGFVIIEGHGPGRPPA